MQINFERGVSVEEQESLRRKIEAGEYVTRKAAPIGTRKVASVPNVSVIRGIPNTHGHLNIFQGRDGKLFAVYKKHLSGFW